MYLIRFCLRYSHTTLFQTGGLGIDEDIAHKKKQCNFILGKNTL